MSRVIVFFVCMLLALGCSRAAKKPVSSEATPQLSQLSPRVEGAHPVRRIIPYTLRVRRPVGASVDPRVGPGGEDYVSHPLPDARLDCETPRSLFRSLKFAELRACLRSLGAETPVAARYRLRRVVAPELVLEEPEDAPECLRATLPVIPVPREVFFQSLDEGRLLCYSSRLDVEANETAGLRLPTHRLSVRIGFPLAERDSPLGDDDELTMLLLSWALTPLWEERGKERVLPSFVVPDHLCKACVGEAGMVKPNGPPPRQWP